MKSDPQALQAKSRDLGEMVSVECLLGEEGRGSKWVGYLRRGRIFMICKGGDRCRFLLYRPQKMLSRLWRFACVQTSRLGVVWPGKIQRFDDGRGSTIKVIESLTEGEVIEVLPGNPDHQDLRAVALLRGGTGLWVAKIAFDEDGRSSLAHELEILELLGEKGELGLPKVVFGVKEERFMFFMLPYYPKPWKWNAFGLRRLLSGWLNNEVVSLRSSDNWIKIQELLEEVGAPVSLCEEIGQLECARSLVHGDLAPWNVMVDERGEPVVIDWESGNLSGLAGLDLVHWFFQLEYYVHRRSPLKSAKRVIAELHKEDYRGFLNQIGWGGDVRRLAAVHFATGWLVPREARTVLVKFCLGL